MFVCVFVCVCLGKLCKLHASKKRCCCSCLGPLVKHSQRQHKSFKRTQRRCWTARGTRWRWRRQRQPTAGSGQRIRSYRSNKDSDCDGQVNWKFELHRTDGRRQSRRRRRCRPAVRVHFVILWMCRVVVVVSVALAARVVVVVVVAWLLLRMLLPLLLLLPLLTGPQLAVSASFTQLSTSLSFSDISSSLLH